MKGISSFVKLRYPKRKFFNRREVEMGSDLLRVESRLDKILGRLRREQGVNWIER